MAINDLKGAAAQQYINGYQLKPFGNNVGTPKSTGSEVSVYGKGFNEAISSRPFNQTGELSLPKVGGEYSTNGNIFDANINNIGEAYMGANKQVEPPKPDYATAGANILSRDFGGDTNAAMEYLLNSKLA